MLFILGIDYKYYEQLISYKFQQNRLINIELLPFTKKMQKAILAFLCYELHIFSKLLYLTTSHYGP